MPNRKGNKKNGKAAKAFSNTKKKPRVKGNGAYAMAGLAKALAGAVAKKVASAIPKGTFERKGAAIGRGLSRFSGFGDYVMNDIVHKTATMKRGVPVQTISNCEYIRDIKAPGGSDFVLSKLPCNASDTTFPWLQTIGRLYTKYRFKQLLFEFRTMSSDYAAGVGLGSVIMAPLYNVNQDDFLTKQQMEAATHAVSFKPSNSCVCGVECASEDNQVKWYNVRTIGQEVTPFTDQCKFYYAVAGCPATAGTVLGELWVHYTMELIEPVLTPQSIGTSANWAGLRTTATTAGILDTSFGGIATSPSALAVPPPAAFDPLTISVADGVPTGGYFVGVDSGQKRLWFRLPGKYQLTWNCALTVAPTGTPTTGTTAVGLYTASPGAGTPTVTATMGQAAFTGFDKKVFSQTWLIETKTLDSSVTFAFPSWVGGIASTVVENTTSGSQMLVTRIA